MATTNVYGINAARDLSKHQVPLAACRNADGTIIDATGGAGLFKIQAVGWGGGSNLHLLGEDAQSNTKTDTLCFEFALPPKYVAAADVNLLVSAGFGGSGTDGTVTIDAEVYEISALGVPTSIRASSTKNLGAGLSTHTFDDITETALAPGDKLMVLIRTVIQETGGANPIYSAIGKIEFQIDTKG